MGTAF